MAATVQLGDELEDDAFRAAICQGRHPFERRCDVGDAQRTSSSVCTFRDGGRDPPRALGRIRQTRRGGPPPRRYATKGQNGVNRDNIALHRHVSIEPRAPMEPSVREPVNARGRTTRGVRASLGRARLDVPGLGWLPAGGPGRVAIGAGIGIGALLLKGVLNALLGGDSGFIPLTAAVALAAWICGLAGGLTTTMVTALGNLIVYRRSRRRFVRDQRDRSRADRRCTRSRGRASHWSSPRSARRATGWSPPSPPSPPWRTTSSAATSAWNSCWPHRAPGSGSGISGRANWSGRRRSSASTASIPPTGAPTFERYMRDGPSRGPSDLPGLHRRGPGPRHVVQPRVPRALDRRLGPLDPRGRARLP